MIISRYFTMDKFEKLIEQKGIFFSKALGQSDLTEGVYHPMLTGSIARALGAPEKQVLDKEDAASNWMERVRSNTFLSCWTKGDEESLFMWCEYAKNCGVRLVTDVTSLEAALGDIARLLKSGEVIYDSDAKLWSELSNVNPYFLKDKCYSKENEYRFVFDENIVNLYLDSRDQPWSEPTLEYTLPQDAVQSVKRRISRKLHDGKPETKGYILKLPTAPLHFNHPPITFKFIHKIIFSPGLCEENKLKVKQLLKGYNVDILDSKLNFHCPSQCQS